MAEYRRSEFIDVKKIIKGKDLLTSLTAQSTGGNTVLVMFLAYLGYDQENATAIIAAVMAIITNVGVLYGRWRAKSQITSVAGQMKREIEVPPGLIELEKELETAHAKLAEMRQAEAEKAALVKPQAESEHRDKPNSNRRNRGTKGDKS